MSIANEIKRIQSAKQDIADAIVAKGGSLGGESIDTFAQAIAELPSGGGIEIELITGDFTNPEYVIPEVVDKLRSYAFSYCSFESVTLPSTLNTLPTYCFNSCSQLKTINNVENLTLINSYSIQFCAALERITLPSVTTINSYSFRGDTALKYVECGSILSSIGSCTFMDCTSLEVVDLSRCSQIARLLNVNAFDNVPTTCEIRVPAALYTDWIKGTNWAKLYANGYNFVAV